jgi:subtilisin family serine protease
VWPFDSESYTTASGTSLSTPLVASAVACLIGARPAWTPAEMRRHLFETAGHSIQFGGPDPRFVLGYGILDAAGALAHGCASDINGDGVVNTQDVLAFLNLWTAGEPGADFNGDGAIDTRDVLEFLNAWVAGC